MEEYFRGDYFLTCCFTRIIIILYCKFYPDTYVISALVSCDMVTCGNGGTCVDTQRMGLPLNIMGSFAKKVRFIIVRGIFSIISDTDFK